MTCVYCGVGRGHWPWCTRPTYRPEPVNVHAVDCEIWLGQGPCDCGAAS